MDLLNQLSLARARALFQQKYIPAKCLSTDAVGKCVYISGPDVAGTYQVSTADPLDGSSKMPAFGIIISKSSATECLVQVTGELKGLITSLVPGRVVFVAADGSITQTIPTAPLSQLAYIQSMGVALTSDVLLVMPDFSIIKRQG